MCFPMVWRLTVNFPFRFSPLMWVNPRKFNVSGLPSPFSFPVLLGKPPEFDRGISRNVKAF